MAEPASGSQRARTNGKVEGEKRKRSRVTPEQLLHLERFFSMDRSPTAARRKEISGMLGMQERQTQIWFQNRRAKAKLQESKKGRGTSVEMTPDTPPQLVIGYEVELHNLLHEDEPVTIIPCSNLSVGTWRRIATTHNKHDLVAYLSDTKRCLTWFIHSSGFGFKMEIPFDTIVSTEFTNAAPGSGLASFFLSQSPVFYLESSRDCEPIRHWKKCADWTEDQQATKVLRHDLVGPAVQLAHVLRHLNTHTSGSDIPLHSPNYRPQEPPPSVLNTQPPPLAVFTSPGYHYHPQDNADPHRRSSASEHQLPFHDGPLHLPVERPDSGVVPELDLPMYPRHPRHPPTGVGPSILYPSNPEFAPPYRISHPSLPANSGSSRSFSPHDSHQRSYAAGSASSLPYENSTGILSFPDGLQLLGSEVPTSFPTPSPPLLTTPFYPAGSPPNAGTSGTYNPTIPITSGIPGMAVSDTDS